MPSPNSRALGLILAALALGPMATARSAGTAPVAGSVDLESTGSEERYDWNVRQVDDRSILDGPTLAVKQVVGADAAGTKN